MPYIYRVENEFKDGCYLGSREAFEICSKHGSFFNPSPQEDIGIQRCPEPNEICGFKDKEQVERWFSKEELKDLTQVGYNLLKVKVREITAIGEAQVLAIR